MSKRNDKLRPLGICRQLISFIINNLIGQGPKKVTLGAALPPDESIEVPIAIAGSSRNIRIRPSKTNIGNGALNNEVIIDFRHIEEPEISVPTFSSRVDFTKKNGFISMTDQTLMYQCNERQKHSDARDIPRPPLISSNINEMADAFIRSRKETMSKNYGFEQPRKF